MIRYVSIFLPVATEESEGPWTRADNIRAYLIRSGLPADRIVAAGHGGRSPLVQCAYGTSRQALVDCLQTNRRVEIIVSGDRE